jgi:hypothetical protein
MIQSILPIVFSILDHVPATVVFSILRHLPARAAPIVEKIALHRTPENNALNMMLLPGV